VKVLKRSSPKRLGEGHTLAKSIQTFSQDHRMSGRSIDDLAQNAQIPTGPPDQKVKMTEQVSPGEEGRRIYH
jgi:hypothetical protein